MNKEQHDILYSRARVVLNHNVKRLWFKINPFLERKRTLKGKPELETKFVQPLQSAVLCEKFFVGEGDQSARDSRNIPLGNYNYVHVLKLMRTVVITANTTLLNRLYGGIHF